MYATIGVWAFAAIVIGTGYAVHRHEVYYGDTGYCVFPIYFFHQCPLIFIFIFFLGCWIVEEFPVERIVTEYLWVWVSGFFMILLYGVMFAVIRRWFTISQTVRWSSQLYQNPLNIESEDDKRLKAVANSML